MNPEPTVRTSQPPPAAARLALAALTLIALAAFPRDVVANDPGILPAVGVTHQLEAASSVSGRLIAQLASDQSTAGVTVTVLETSQQTVTDKDGNFSFSAIAPGRYTLLASGAGFSPLRIVDVVVQKGQNLVLATQAMPALRKNGVPRTAREVTAIDSDVTRMAEFEVDEGKIRAFSEKNIDLPRTINDPQPYYIFTGDEMVMSGAINVEDFLKKYVTMDTEAQTANQVWASGTGTTSAINLRGLGAAQTLILVNGRPMPGITFLNAVNPPDVNSIAPASIERIEILPSGASAIYGGGAVGGVVNIVLKRNYTGGYLQYTFDTPVGTHAPTKTVDANYGMSLEGGRTHVMLTGHFFEESPLTIKDRPQLTQRGVNYILARNPAYLAIFGSTAFIGTFPNLTLPNNSSEFGLNNTIGFAQRNKSFTMSADRQMTSKVDLVAAFSNGTNYGFGSFDPFGNKGITIPKTSPINTTGASFVVPIPDDFFAPFRTLFLTRTFSVGLTAQLPFAWQARVDYAWSYNVSKNTSYSYDGTALSIAEGNGTLNPLVPGQFNLTPYLRPAEYQGSPYTQNSFAVRGSGPVGHLPWGSPSLTIGGEKKAAGFHDGAEYFVFPLTPASDENLLYFGQLQENYNGYAEALIPLVTTKNAMTGLRALDIQIAARDDYYYAKPQTAYVLYYPNNPSIAPISPTPVGYSRRSTYSSANETYALRYKPLNSLTLRASYANAFLPPTIAQLLPNATPSVPSTTTITDPKTGTTYSGYQTIGGGNTNLSPQTAKTILAGVIYEPFKGLRFDLEYYRIQENNVITTLTAQQIVNSYPDRVTRDPTTGLITLINTSYINSFLWETNGWDFSANYVKQTSSGIFGLRAMATIVEHERRQVSLGNPSLEYVGFVADGGPAKTKANATFSWQFHGWSLAWTTFYFDSYKQYYSPGDPVYGNTVNPTLNTIYTLAQGSNRVSAQVYHDLMVRYDFGYRPLAAGKVWENGLLSNLSIQLQLKNVLNAVPPVDVRYAPYFYSPFGDAGLREIAISVKKAF